jgi:hypothetical protein
MMALLIFRRPDPSIPTRLVPWQVPFIADIGSVLLIINSSIKVLDAFGYLDFSNAAAPATIGEENEVPCVYV